MFDQLGLQCKSKLQQLAAARVDRDAPGPRSRADCRLIVQGQTQAKATQRDRLIVVVDESNGHYHSLVIEGKTVEPDYRWLAADADRRAATAHQDQGQGQDKAASEQGGSAW